MSKQQITLKLNGLNTDSQRAWKRRLNSFCRGLVERGAAVHARAHEVFPGDGDPEMASMFTIDVEHRNQANLDFTLQSLRALPQVQYAQLIGRRETLPSKKWSHSSRRRIPKDKWNSDGWLNTERNPQGARKLAL